MSQRLKKNVDVLSHLSRAKPQMVKAIVGAADKELLTCLCECAQNLIKGNVSLSKQHKSKLKRYKKDVRTLVKKNIGKQKKKILQKGGFLPALLAPIAAQVLAPLVTKLVRR